MITITHKYLKPLEIPEDFKRMFYKLFGDSDVELDYSNTLLIANARMKHLKSNGTAYWFWDTLHFISKSILNDEALTQGILKISNNLNPSVQYFKFRVLFTGEIYKKGEKKCVL